MVAPFTSYSKNITEPRFVLRATGTRQKPPYVNTAYSCKTYQSGKGFLAPTMNNVNMENSELAAKTEATNVARKRLVGELGDVSSIGATLTAERRETYGMVKSGIVTAFRSARAVRRGNLLEAARILGISPPEVKVIKTFPLGKRRKDGSRRRRKATKTVYELPSGRQVAHNVSGRWLWWSYGVNPLMGDMYNSVDVLQREQPWRLIHGRGTGTGLYRKVYSAASIHNYESKCKVSMSVNVRLKNPNLFLANQLGLTNPIQWINEAIPFSFVIDWFSNLSQVISQMTDFVGLETADPVTATKNVCLVSIPTVYGYELLTRQTFSRELSIPAAKLRFAYEKFGWQRGANAIALLVGFLKKH